MTRKAPKLYSVIGLVFFYFLFTFSNTSFAQEKINSFDVEIRINQDASLNVREKIEYDFGDEDHHGIFRFIPIEYQARGGTYGLRVSGVAVFDELGNTYNFQQYESGHSLEIKIGDADKLVRGRKTYIINYAVRRAINYFEDHDELYWNVTGNEWQAQIEKSSVKVLIPNVIEQEKITSDCFRGYLGETDKCFYSDGSRLSFETGRLDVGEGMTIVVGLPTGVLHKPTAWENFWETVRDNWIVFLPILVFLAMLYLWMKKGRDPKGRGTIIAQFEAPDNLSPAEIGTIIDEKSDNADISAEIIYLATLGYLKIRRIEEKKFLFKSTDYELEKIKDFSEEESFQKKLMNGLFSGGKKKVKLSSLKYTFYKKFEEVRKDVYSSVVRKGYFGEDPNKIRSKYMIIGIFTGFSAFFIGPIFGFLGVVSVIISGLIIIVFSRFMPARTKGGAIVQEQILGLREYLSVAEKDRLQFHNAPEKNPERFEKLLPYAMALGVEKKWAEQFKDVYQNQNPSWYTDSSGGSFNSFLLANSLGDFSSSAKSTLVSNPSSASSGGSGFSGGGSGGGFGGGGGGSW